MKLRAAAMAWSLPLSELRLPLEPMFFPGLGDAAAALPEPFLCALAPTRFISLFSFLALACEMRSATPKACFSASARRRSSSLRAMPAARILDCTAATLLPGSAKVT